MIPMTRRTLLSKATMKTIEKNKITGVLDFLAEKYQLFAPTPKDNFNVDFDEVISGEQVELDFYNSKKAPKRLIFPQLETLLSYSRDGGRSVPAAKPQKLRVIFGLRPCDTRSLVLLDKVFDAGDCKDPYYMQKRENTAIFTLACNNPQSTCFCTSVGLGPACKEGSDVFVMNLGDKYLFEPITETGRKITEEIPGLEEAQQSDVTKAENLAVELESKVREAPASRSPTPSLQPLSSSLIFPA